jgi:GNAT superfamily N-acetyltransferase
VNVARYADRPDLLAIRWETLSSRAFPEYMNHNEPGARYWERLYDEHPDYQLALLDGDALVAEFHSVPMPWDGSLADLPSGWDDAFTRAFESERAATVLCALALAVLPERQGERLSSVMLNAMREAGREGALGRLVAPVRPTRKASYPLIPIEEYIRWRREDGLHFDPWIRIHERVGGSILAPAPESMVIEASVADWEAWTKLPFPADGTYVVPGMLSPLVVKRGIGRHVEPNLWLVHDV